jgi:hypothetical protein
MGACASSPLTQEEKAQQQGAAKATPAAAEVPASTKTAARSSRSEAVAQPPAGPGWQQTQHLRRTQAAPQTSTQTEAPATPQEQACTQTPPSNALSTTPSQTETPVTPQEQACTQTPPSITATTPSQTEASTSSQEQACTQTTPAPALISRDTQVTPRSSASQHSQLSLLDSDAGEGSLPERVSLTEAIQVCGCVYCPVLCVQACMHVLALHVCMHAT